ncbi:MAG: hypothetical protein LBF75_03280 [Treponema sp.]|nr:hypothetical protein [Treponema sp.]
MALYKNFDRSQGLFRAVSLEEQRIPDSFDHTLEYLIDQFDLSAFDAAFHNDDKGVLYGQGCRRFRVLGKGLGPGPYHEFEGFCMKDLPDGRGILQGLIVF